MLAQSRVSSEMQHAPTGDRQAPNQLGSVRGAVIMMIYGPFRVSQIDLHSRLDDCVINAIAV